jgi:hypothetical protein
VPVQNPPAPVQPEQRPSHKAAKADAKAAKAYAKAQRSWYQKKRFILPLGAFLLIMVISVAAGGSTNSTTAEPGTTSPAPAAKSAANQPTDNAALAANNGPTAKLPIQNGDWRLDSIRVKNDGVGDFGATTRVTYTGDNPEGGTNLFTVTVFVGGKDVAVLNGSANSVQPGQAATVQLISTDKFVGGPYKFDFQNDL